MATKPIDPNAPLDPNDPLNARGALTAQMDDPTADPNLATTNGNTTSKSTSVETPAPTPDPTPAPTPTPDPSVTPPYGTTFNNTKPTTVTQPPGGNAPPPGSTFPGAGGSTAPGGPTAPGSPNDPTQYTDPQTLLAAQLNFGVAGNAANGYQGVQGVVDQINKQFNLQPGSSAAVYAGQGPNGTPIIALPTGYLAVGPDGKWGFTPRGADTGAGTTTTATPPDINSIGTNTDPDGFSANLRDLLTSQMAGLTGPVDAKNPDIAPEIGAYNTQSQRDQQSNRDQLAEDYYASGAQGGSGLDSGAFGTAKQAAAESFAGQRANYTGSAVFQEAQARRTQLTQLLQTATTYGLTSQAQTLQAEIAKIDAQLQEQGLTQQNSQFGDSLGFNYASLIAQENRDALLYGMQG